MTYGAYYLIYQDKIYPGVQINRQRVGGMTRVATQSLLENQVADYQKIKKLTAVYENQTWEIPLPQSDKWQVETTANEAFYVGRTGNWQRRLTEQWEAIRNGRHVQMRVMIDEVWLETQTGTIAAELDIPLIPPSVSLNEKDQLVTDKGKGGKETDQAALTLALKQRLSNFESQSITVVVKPLEIEVTDEQLEQAKTRAEGLLKRKLTLTTGDLTSPYDWEIDGQDLIGWLSVTNEWNQEAIGAYITEVATTVDRPAQNAKFQFDESSNKVKEFEPALDGLTVDYEPTVKVMEAALKQLETGEVMGPVTLVMKRAKPEITLERVNDLGIKELLGRGESTYKGSIPSRVHNVALAASRINGTLVKPGETFSFNQAVGDISAATGYQAAYVIKQGRTELGDGGGVCQDSTTVFRAALKAGLPIEERRAHAYRVGYYEQDVKAGIDATVYAPSPDLKFTNDTPAHLLIQAKADSANRYLAVEIYGTSDGRMGEITNHTVCCITPPPPDVYVDDPTLPTGQIKEVEHKVAGAKARFDYKVTRGGEVIYEKTFVSNYKPWAAVFMRGTGP